MTSLPSSELIVPPSEFIVAIFASEGGLFYEGGNRASNFLYAYTYTIHEHNSNSTSTDT